VHLRAEGKSSSTLKSYTDGVRTFLIWCREHDHEPALTRSLVNQFVVSLLDGGAQPSTATSRQLSVRRFSAWLFAEGESSSDDLIGLKPPKIPTKVIEPLTEEELKALLRACAGKQLRDRRDEACVRIMLETGLRAEEVVSLQVADVNLSAGRLVVRRGKGGKGRVVGIGSKACQSIDRYLRVRRTHIQADHPDLWLGDRGKNFSYYGLHAALKKRAEAAGVQGFHPHLLRHTAAHRWLAAGGSESGLMATAGWTRPDMLMRYTQARASDRAIAEARELGLGDI